MEKLLQKFVVHIFTLLLAPFTLKLVHYSRHSESLKYVWKSTISCLRRKMSSISEFFRMFKDSLWREWLTNFDAKGAKRSVKMWTTNLYKIFFQKYCVLVYMNARLSKICSVHKYVILRTVYFGRICVQIPKSPKMELIFFKNAYYIKKNTCKSYKEWSSLMQI